MSLTAKQALARRWFRARRRSILLGIGKQYRIECDSRRDENAAKLQEVVACEQAIDLFDLEETRCRQRKRVCAR